jgi:hypothetical protein
MRVNHSTVTWACAALLAVGILAQAEPASARPRGLGGPIAGGLIGAAIGGALLGGPRPGYARPGVRRGDSRRGRGRSQEDSGEDSSSSRQDSRAESRRNRALASIGAPSAREQTKVLKSITASGMLGMVGSTKDVNEVGRNILRDVEDSNRDFTKRIKKDILDRLLGAKQANDKNRGDVTEHAIEQSLEKAFKHANLDTFVSFIGENWSAERLRVYVLDRVDAELGRLLFGTTLGNVPMDDLDKLIQRSAESVYRRIFETSELLAANRSSALFLQRLYQAHGSDLDVRTREDIDRIIARLRENIDDVITAASNAAIAKFDAPMRRDENSFALRYRAQRIVFDCFSENVERISSLDAGMLEPDDIAKEIMKAAVTTCVPWLEAQFGTERDKVKPQKPMPLRVIWMARPSECPKRPGAKDSESTDCPGPKDDPSMYGRASGSL